MSNRRGAAMRSHRSIRGAAVGIAAPETRREGRSVIARLSMSDRGAERLFRRVADGAGEFILMSSDGSVSVRVGLALEAIDDIVERLSNGKVGIDWARSVIGNGQNRIGLSKTELRLLSALVDHCGDAVPRRSLIARVWPRALPTTERENALAVYICTLRKRLTAIGLGDALRTVRGVGYRFVV
jgi:DNA-binding response OmpR family regulator